MNAMTRIRVLIADHEPRARESMAASINADASMELAGSAVDAAEAVAIAAATAPDIAVVDVLLPGGSALATRDILKCSPLTRVLAFAATAGSETVLEMLRAGAAGYLIKGETRADVLDGIRNAADGQPLLPQMTRSLVDRLSQQGQDDRADTAARGRQLGLIRNALSGDGFSIVYQPIVNLRSGLVVGYEALSRFHADPPEPPDVWFRDAEQFDLRAELELVAVRKALSQRNQLPPASFLAVNLSPQTLIRPAAEVLLGPAMADGLVIEITEHAPIQDYKPLRSVVHEFRLRRARLAIDDTGSGYASLRHLLELSPDIIKIDISITHRLEDDRGARALVAGLVAFGTEIGSTLVAEGIENERQRDVLLAMDIPLGQGYLLGRPAPVTALSMG